MHTYMFAHTKQNAPDPILILFLCSFPAVMNPRELQKASEGLTSPLYNDTHRDTHDAENSFHLLEMPSLIYPALFFPPF